MSPNEIVENLRPIRLPAEFATFGAMDFVVFAVTGGLLGWCLFHFLVRRFFAPPPPQISLDDAIDALRPQSRPLQIAGIVALWQNHFAPDPMPENLRKALYDPHMGFDIEDYAPYFRDHRR